MGDMRADMGGAAVTVAAMKAIAQAGLKGRIVALTPLAENMPAGNASKPGDVVVARNGKTIQIDNTDAEGRLLLCDTLDYAAEVHKPTAMIDSATLTGAMVIALGSGATGVFCKNDNLWSFIEKSGFETGDRAWRMPHYKHYFGKIHIKI
jgi:aminopeptidase